MGVMAFKDGALLSSGEVHGGMASYKAMALSSQQRVVRSSGMMFKENSKLGMQSSPDIEERWVEGEDVVSGFGRGEAAVKESSVVRMGQSTPSWTSWMKRLGMAVA